MARTRSKTKKTQYVSANPDMFPDAGAQAMGECIEHRESLGIPVQPGELLSDIRSNKKHRLRPFLPKDFWNDPVLAEKQRKEVLKRMIRWTRLRDARDKAQDELARLPLEFTSVTETRVVNGEDMNVREFQRRETVVANADKLEQKSCEIYRTIRGLAENARDLGLDIHEEAWKRILQAIFSNEPNASKFGR